MHHENTSVAHEKVGFCLKKETTKCFRRFEK